MINALNFFRILGTIYIFLFHLYIFSSCKYLGEIGVELFFVLSGFVLTISVKKKEVTFFEFIWKRFKKLYPSYIITSFVGLVLVLIINNLNPFLTILKWIPSALCIQTLIPIGGLPTLFNGASWYIATLLFCYMGFYFVNSSKYGYIYGTIYSFIVIILSSIISENIMYISPFSRFVDVFIGMIAGRLFLNIYNNKNILSISNFTFSIVEIMTICVLVLFTIFYKSYYSSIYLLGLAYACTYIVFSFQKGFISKLFQSEIIRKISGYSLYFYLVHYLIISALLYNNKLYFIDNQYIKSFILFFISILFACLLKYIDKLIHSRLLNTLR